MSGQVIKTRVGKSQILVLNRVRVLGSEPHTSTKLFGSTPWGGHVEAWSLVLSLADSLI